MSKSKTEPKNKHSYRKLNIVTMGGKGGVGKTTFVTALREWFEEVHIPVGLIDLDYENRERGGLHFFLDEAKQVNMRDRDALDVFLDTLDAEQAVVLADMGAGQGSAAFEWFETFHMQATKRGAGFLVVGLVTDDPASVASVLQWGDALKDKVNYLIVLNQMNDQRSTFKYWYDSPAAKQFVADHQPSIMTMHSRLPIMQNHMNDHGLSLRAVADGQAKTADLRRVRYIAQAEETRTRLFAEFGKVIPQYLPDLE